MSIGGARKLEIDDRAWDQLAADINYRSATLRSARIDLVRRAGEQSSQLTAQLEHDNEPAQLIAKRIADLQTASG